MEVWRDTCAPSLDSDSPLAWHRGSSSIPPFQTHSRYFYAPLGEGCCGRHFVDLFYQQFHPYPQCLDCARLTLGVASHICWQCRTYFRRYGTGMMQQIVGITPQRYDLLNIIMPEQGPNQRRLPEEIISQGWRDEGLQRIQPDITQILLPRAPTCQFWIDTLNHLHTFGNGPCLVNLPVVPMPYHDANALLLLPATPQDGFCSGLSRYAESIEAPPSLDMNADQSAPPDDET